MIFVSKSERYYGQDRGRHWYGDLILTLSVTVMNVILMAICFDFYYDLNDDTMMLDIMSGAYSGMPDGHNMQTLYPLGAVIAFCYRLYGGIPWYGLFLCLCQFGCFCLTGMRLCALAGGVWISDGTKRRRCSYTLKKLSLLLVLSLFVWGVCLAHFINIQYTVTSAMMSATAVFLFLTAPGTGSVRQFVIRNIPAVALVIIAYQLRSEMLLLSFPFICLAGLYRITEEKKIFVRENLFRYGGVLGIILVGLLLSRGSDYIAYHSKEWKEFLRFFNARTTVYDFYPELINEEKYEEALAELGVTPDQQALLRNYNFGLDDTINSDLLTKVADYATGTRRAAKDWGSIIREQSYRYFYRTFRGGDSPYSTMLLWMYAALIMTGFGVRFRGRKQAIVQTSGRPSFSGYAFLWQVLLLASARSAIWMFVLLRGRDPARITHSLYLVELALLAAMAIRILSRRDEDALSVDAGAEETIFGNERMSYDPQDSEVCRTYRTAQCIRWGMALIFFLITGSGVMNGVSALQEDQAWRRSVNRNWYAIDEYCKEHKENFYFEDVYSTVGFSRKIFDSVFPAYANYDIMGGWMCKSPLYYDKMGRYGAESAQAALLEQNNVYLIISDLEAMEQGFEWVEDHYDAQNTPVTVEKTDTVGEGYSVYRIVRR